MHVNRNIEPGSPPVLLIGTVLSIFTLALIGFGCGRDTSVQQQKADSLQKVIHSLHGLTSANNVAPQSTEDTISTPPPPPPQDKDTIDESIRKCVMQWKSIRNSPDESVGKSFEWVAMTDVIYSSGVELGFGKNRIYAYSDQILLPDYSTSGLPHLHEGDWVRFSGIFEKVDDDGKLIFEPKKLKNLGNSYGSGLYYENN